jgi:preprotein translocase subunit SecA
VLGTERHEARRIDNQLRGRSGRQGDPGETQFYVSLEDDLMRIFGAEKIKSMMGRFGIPEDMPIENRFIGKSLESAQAKIEGFHFDARKNTLEYDDVMNHQRKIIYSRRQQMLFADKEGIDEILNNIVNVRPEFEIVIKDKKEKLGDEAFYETVRRIALYTTDTLWMEHLEAMDYLKSSVNLRAYGQREPIVEYKKDGLQMFKEMEIAFEEQVFTLVSNINPEQAKNAKREEAAPTQTLMTNQGQNLSKGTIRNEDPNKDIGRNDPCPCGSGKKYKKCGLLNTPEHQKNMQSK